MGGVAAPRYLLLQFLIVFKAVRSPSSGWLAKGAIFLAVLSLLAPFSRILGISPGAADWDKIGALVICFFAARAAAPAIILDRSPSRPTRARRSQDRPTPWQHVQFMIRIVRSDLANFFLYQHRHVDALLITGKNSGTHWLKFMLSCTLAKQYAIPRPRHASGNSASDIIGDPRRRHADPRVPRIGSSHTIPSIVCGWPWFVRAVPQPPVVVLVRDIRDAMASHYVKWQDRLGVPLATYVRGHPSGRRYKADLWWYIRFFNRWGDLAQANPAKILMVWYEELQADPAACLRRIAAHWRLEFDDAAFNEALRVADRDTIRALLDPEDSEIAVPPDGASASVVYSRRDEAFMRNVMARYLRRDMGYGYASRVKRCAQGHAIWSRLDPS